MSTKQQKESSYCTIINIKGFSLFVLALKHRVPVSGRCFNKQSRMNLPWLHVLSSSVSFLLHFHRSDPQLKWLSFTNGR